MVNLNEIAFIDTDGFDYNDGECLVRFDTVMYCPDKKLITFAVTKQGRISVLDYQVFEDERRLERPYSYGWFSVSRRRKLFCKDSQKPRLIYRRKRRRKAIH